jgi:hypothetical protein
VFFFVVTITGRVFAGAAPCAPALLLFLFVLFSRCASAYRVVRREREREREREGSKTSVKKKDKR